METDRSVYGGSSCNSGKENGMEECEEDAGRKLRSGKNFGLY
jgi:hypothetical protein